MLVIVAAFGTLDFVALYGDFYSLHFPLLSCKFSSVMTGTKKERIQEYIGEKLFSKLCTFIHNGDLMKAMQVFLRAEYLLTNEWRNQHAHPAIQRMKLTLKLVSLWRLLGPLSCSHYSSLTLV